MTNDLVPAPWSLSGRGIIVLAAFRRAFVEPWLTPVQRKQFIGGPGAVICVDYATSGVGPYRELLFIPGLFRVGNRFFWQITTIYVSTQQSVTSGRANWAIPKQQADFSLGSDLQHFSVDAGDGQPFFSLDNEAHGPAFPVKSSWLPGGFALAQTDQRGTLITRPEARGAVRRAHIWRIWGDDVHFPNLAGQRILMSVVASQVELVFPLAKMLQTSATEAD